MIIMINQRAMNSKKISAVKARQNFGQILNEVSINNQDYIIERAGKPLAVVVSTKKYSKIKNNYKEAKENLDGIWQKLKDQDPKKTDKAIEEAVIEARKDD